MQFCFYAILILCKLHYTLEAKWVVPLWDSQNVICKNKEAALNHIEQASKSVSSLKRKYNLYT